MICLSLTADTLDADLEILRRHLSHVDLVELRADLLTEADRAGIASFPARVGRIAGPEFPTIFTVRRTAEGGRYHGTESARTGMLLRAVEAGFTHIDLELDLRHSSDGRRVAEAAQAAGCTVIRSVHDTGGMPPDMPARIADLSSGGAEIAKLAVTPRSTADLFRLLETADSTRGIRKILVGMGSFGIVSRILSRRFGSLLTYVSDPEEAQAAPGHLGPLELDEIYRYHAVGEHTRFFAVIGNPVSHSRSPGYHNRRFASDGLNACYVPVLVDDVASFFNLADRVPLHGVSVTIPHKRAVLPYLGSTDEGSVAAGSCNTLVRGPAGWTGVNTDVEGFLVPLRRAVGGNLRGVGATVIGAGGAARAVAYALLREGARVFVMNRSAARARRLVADLSMFVREAAAAAERGLEAGPLEPTPRLHEHRDIIVQTTSVGMHGTGDPVPWLEFAGSEVVYDVVYTPPDTPLIRRARAAGCRTITGDEMFDAQADAQYVIFSQLAVG